MDADISSYIVKKRPISLGQRLRSLAPEDVAVSAIFSAELKYGAKRHPTRRDAILGAIDDVPPVLR